MHLSGDIGATPSTRSTDGTAVVGTTTAREQRTRESARFPDGPYVDRQSGRPWSPGRGTMTPVSRSQLTVVAAAQPHPKPIRCSAAVRQSGRDDEEPTVAQIKARRTKSGEARYDVRVRIGSRVVNRTFTRRRDADAYARTVEADRLRGLAVDPRAGLITFETYARRWVGQRPLRPLTRDLYDGILRNHILPTFGERPIGKVMPAEIRTWYAELGTKLAPATTTRVYRLLHSIFATEVEDELVMRNPCLVRDASTASSPERPTATIAEVDALVEAMDEQYRAMVILAAWCGLRLGELLALTRRRIDLDQGTVEVVGIELRTVPWQRRDRATRDGGRPATGIHSSSRPARDRWTPPPLRGIRSGQSGVRRPQGRRPLPRSLRPLVATGTNGRGRGAPALPRPAPHREHSGGHGRRLHQGAHGPHGARQSTGGPHLPARHSRAGQGHRRSPVRPRRAGPEDALAAGFGLAG